MTDSTDAGTQPSGSAELSPATARTTSRAASSPAPSPTAAAIDRAKAAGRAAALICYLPTGFPSVSEATAAVRATIEAGADIVELGLPYSDPVMDGPVIETAVTAALAAGVTIVDTFETIAACRDLDAPIVVMSYYNPIFHHGVAAFAGELAAAGGAGLVTPDLIPDEAADWIAASDAHGLDRIFLVAPSSPPERLRLVAAASRGFVYAASTMGVTGERTQVGARARQLVADTRAAGAERVCVGVGVSTPAQAAEVASYADGVIVGSALVRQLRDGGVSALAATVSKLSAALA